MPSLKLAASLPLKKQCLEDEICSFGMWAISRGKLLVSGSVKMITCHTDYYHMFSENSNIHLEHTTDPQPRTQ